MAEGESLAPEYRWLLDQNVPEIIGQWLERLVEGLKVAHVKQVGLDSADDEEIFDFALKNKWLIVTFDEDFADQRLYPLAAAIMA